MKNILLELVRRWWWKQAAFMLLLISFTILFHFSLTPMVTRFVTFRQISSASSALDLGTAGIRFRNATWKPPVGDWFNLYYGSTTPIRTTEMFQRSKCQNNCGGKGVCYHDQAQCHCFIGYAGVACERKQHLQCNEKVSKKRPFGLSWRVSICSAFCDITRSFCFCGEGTKHPDRPVAESCGFVFQGQEVEWTKRDEDLYSNKSNGVGWCNIDVEEIQTRNITLKEGCYCRYDGYSGQLCDIPNESTCINQCSANGLCRGGFCECDEGWYGIDCSIPSSLPNPKEWPAWLLPATVNMSIGFSNPPESETVEITVVRRRPLVFIYEIPPLFNSHLLQGRHYKYECVNRLYNGQNVTFWTDQLYGAEIALLETLLASSHRTMNADEADFFYVPVFGACAVNRADDAPHMDMQRHHLGLRGFFSGDLYKKAYEYISATYPYWNHSRGQDHIWFFSWDEGACSAPKEIWESMMLVHWGNTNSNHKSSTTAYEADNWDGIPEEWRGNHPCYDPAKDLVMPVWKTPDPYPISATLWARERAERPTLFYFNGNLGNNYKYGRPEPKYSMGIRQKLAEEFGSVPNKAGKLGRQVAPDVIVVSERSPTYKIDLSQSRFCGVLPGDGWSGRLEDSVLQGCIPVIIQDGIHLPYENVLDYESFSVRIAEDDLPRMVSILRSLNDSVVESKLEVIRGMWQRFTYHRAVKLEADRQKLKLSVEDWATQYNSLTNDDAFDTFIQVLFYKLHNDPWRRVSTIH